MGNMNISLEDKKYLDLCVQKAEETFRKHDNYPVGSALVINGKLIELAGNQIKELKSYAHHAENQLIINNATKLHEAFEAGKQIVLYSTLEPCIQCLGASVTNHVDRIVYIQQDPNGGACGLEHDNMGLFYKHHWPEIIHAQISDKILNLMFEFFHSEIKKGNTKWPLKMLSIFEDMKRSPVMTVPEDQEFFVGQKAFIEKDGKVLVLKANFGIDFPGGKIQEGEADFTKALKREVKEETSLTIQVGKIFATWQVRIEKGHKNEGKKVFLLGYKCKYLFGNVKLSHEHIGYKWVDKDDYQELYEDNTTYKMLENYFLSTSNTGGV